MNSKMTTNLQLSTTEPKKQKEKQTKLTTRTGTESHIRRSFVELSLAGRRKGVNGEKGAGIKKHKW